MFWYHHDLLLSLKGYSRKELLVAGMLGNPYANAFLHFLGLYTHGSFSDYELTPRQSLRLSPFHEFM